MSYYEVKAIFFGRSYSFNNNDLKIQKCPDNKTIEQL